MSRRRSRNGLSIGGILLLLAVAAYVAFTSNSDFHDSSLKGLAAFETLAANPNADTIQTVMAPLDNQSLATKRPTAGSPPVSGGQADSWLKVYFTNPDPPDQVDNGMDKFVVAEVDKARKTIDVTSFDLNLPSFVNALAAAAQRGVEVRVVYDGTNGDQKLEASQSPDGKEFNAVTVMRSAGIQLVDDGRSNGLMHDKMIIIDGKTLFVGSWNMSYNDTFRNNNNLLEISDPTLVANYQAKFDELFVDKHFGTKAEVGAQTPQMTIGGDQVLNYFSPVDHVTDKLVGLVDGAKKSVRFIIFTYTDNDLANAMIGRFKAGVDVAGVIENRGASQGALVPLACAKVPVKVDGNKYTMHHKVIVIDGSIVVTGSFNFTKSADTVNDDNVIVIYDSALAKQYLAEFDRIEAIAKDPDPADIKCP
jgi:phosphatidylserine/phosphatidylglycerophosphate/cardiolipin synthase-like enzyme